MRTSGRPSSAAIHPFRKKMDARVKPAHDGGEQRFNSTGIHCDAVLATERCDDSSGRSERRDRFGAGAGQGEDQARLESGRAACAILPWQAARLLQGRRPRSRHHLRDRLVRYHQAGRLEGGGVWPHRCARPGARRTAARTRAVHCRLLPAHPHRAHQPAGQAGHVASPIAGRRAPRLQERQRDLPGSRGAARSKRHADRADKARRYRLWRAAAPGQAGRCNHGLRHERADRSGERRNAGRADARSRSMGSIPTGSRSRPIRRWRSRSPTW